MGEYRALLSLYNMTVEEARGNVRGREYHGLVSVSYTHLTDESEKYDILHKVIEAIKIYSVKTNQKVFTVLFASGLEYNVLYNVNLSLIHI